MDRDGNGFDQGCLREWHGFRQRVGDARRNGDVFGKSSHALEGGRRDADDFAVIAEVDLAARQKKHAPQ